jgi:hypothetical protein
MSEHDESLEQAIQYVAARAKIHGVPLTVEKLRTITGAPDPSKPKLTRWQRFRQWWKDYWDTRPICKDCGERMDLYATSGAAVHREHYRCKNGHEYVYLASADR